MNAMCIPNVKPTLYDRVSKLLESVEWSDCEFRVGPETIRAHRLILAISSPVFKVMLYGPLAEPKDIKISDIDPEIFQLMIDFIYKDKVKIDSLEIACGLLYAAEKYMLTHLIEVCVGYVKKALSIQNVLAMLPFSEWIQEETLVLHCVTLICKHAHAILGKEADHMTASSLHKILQQTYINIGEKELIDFTIRWAKEECAERDLPPSDENQRAVLIETGNLRLLRFHTLLKDDIEYVNGLGILTPREKETLEELLTARLVPDEVSEDLLENTIFAESRNRKPTLDVFECDPENPLDFTARQRISVKIRWQYSCRPIIRSASPLILQEGFQNIKVKFKSAKTIFINSLTIPTRSSVDINFITPSLNQYKESIELSIYAVNDPNYQISAQFVGQVDYNSSQAVYIDLPKPFILKEEEWYTASFTWPELHTPQYVYPLCYRPTMSSDELFTFDDNFETTLPCGSFVEGFKICV